MLCLRARLNVVILSEAKNPSSVASLRATRSADFAVCLEFDAFLAASPDRSRAAAKRVLDRLSDLEMEISGDDVTLTHSLGWIDYKPGEVPSDLIRRAEQGPRRLDPQGRPLTYTASK
jgi:hypothetical protein